MGGGRLGWRRAEEGRDDKRRQEEGEVVARVGWVAENEE